MRYFSLQARGDMGFLWADMGDDMAKTMYVFLYKTLT